MQSTATACEDHFESAPLISERNVSGYLTWTFSEDISKLKDDGTMIPNRN